MSGRAWAISASALGCAGSVAYLVWWQLAHNYVNVSCGNNLYHFHHLTECATWRRASGIVVGVTLPIIIVSAIVLLICGLFAIMERADS